MFVCCLLSDWFTAAFIMSHDTCVSSPGDDRYGRKLITFSSCCLPPSHQLNHRRLLEYVHSQSRLPSVTSSVTSSVTGFPLQVSEVHPGPVRGDGLHTGLLPLRSEEQQQAVPEMVARSVRRVRQEVRHSWFCICTWSRPVLASDWLQGLH